MPLVPPGFSDCNVRLHLTTLTRDAFVTFGVDNGTFIDPILLANSVLASFFNSFKSIIDASVDIGPARIRYGVSSGEPISAESITGGGPGTTGLTSTPPNVAALFLKTTARGGRRGRGRMYLPWCLNTADVNENGSLTGARISTIATAATAFLTALNAAGTPMHLLHTETTGTPTGDPTEVVGMRVSPTVATQRRRLGR